MADYNGAGDTSPVIPPTLLAEVKLALRISSTAYDAEVSGLIESAIGDLVISGVAESVFAEEEYAPLVKRAIITYAKANFGLDNPDSEKYMESFLSQERALALSAEYKEPSA